MDEILLSLTSLAVLIALCAPESIVGAAHAQPVSLHLEAGSGTTTYMGDLSDVNREKPRFGLPHVRARLTIGFSPHLTGAVSVDGGDYPRAGRPSLRYHPRWAGNELPEPTFVYSSTWRFAGEAALRWYPTGSRSVAPFLSLGGYAMGGGSTDGFKGVHGVAVGPSLGLGVTVPLTERLALLVEERTRAAFPDGALDGYVGSDRRPHDLPFDLTATMTVGIRLQLAPIGRGRGSPAERVPASRPPTSEADSTVTERVVLSSSDTVETRVLEREILCERRRRNAVRLYRRGDFQQARDTVQVCLDDRVVSTYGRVRALRIVALSHLAENDVRPAQRALIELLEEMPAYRSDPTTDPPTFVELLESTRSLLERVNPSGTDRPDP